MSEGRTPGPRSKDEALRQIAMHLIGELNATELEEIWTPQVVKKMTDAQVKRAEWALDEMTRRLNKMTGRGKKDDDE